MVERLLVGSRIRQRRLALGQKQAELAEKIAISPSYLNLIEHNKRRIAGKLITRIADALETSVPQLTEGAETSMVDAVRQAATQLQEKVETVRAEDPIELVTTFPGWAQAFVDQRQVIDEQDNLIHALTDRLRHDPQLAASLHEVLSVITSVRSTSGILAQEPDIEPAWQQRFQRNLFEDSQRLAESAKGLVAFLEEIEPSRSGAQSEMPVEVLNSWLHDNSCYFSALEDNSQPWDAIQQLLQAHPMNEAAMILAEAFLEKYAQDALAIPLNRIWSQDPISLAAATGAPIEVAIRRIFVNEKRHGREAGLVSCDSSGAIGLRILPDGFDLPTIGAACPLLPLFQALNEPNRPVRQIVEHTGYAPRRYLTYAAVTPVLPIGVEGPQVYRSSMLILPGDEADDHKATKVGPTCRTCPRNVCGARREPSVLSSEG